MSEYAKLQFESQLGVGTVGLYNGKRVLFSKHGRTILPHDRLPLSTLNMAGQDSILLEKSSIVN